MGLSVVYMNDLIYSHLDYWKNRIEGLGFNIVKFEKHNGNYKITGSKNYQKPKLHYYELSLVKDCGELFFELKDSENELNTRWNIYNKDIKGVWRNKVLNFLVENGLMNTNPGASQSG